jgi:hypothetical protein
MAIVQSATDVRMRPWDELITKQTDFVRALFLTLESFHPLRVAAADCAVDTSNPDTCGVCHKHFDECEDERVWYDDTPPMTRDKSEPECPGARVRIALRGVPR